MTTQKKAPRSWWWLCGTITLMAVVAAIVVWQEPWGNLPVGTLRVGSFPIREGERWGRLLDVTVSPDGEYVACRAVFAPRPPSRLKTRMVIMPLQVPAPTPMWLDTRFLVVGGFTWSPDGSASACWGKYKVEGRSRIMVCDIQTRLLRAITVADKQWLDYPGFLKWSPTGEWLAFTRNPWTEPSSGCDLWVVRPDGSESRPVTDHGLVRPTSYWSPDGSQLYYVKRRALGESVGDVYSVYTGVDDKAEQRITHNLDVEYIAGASPDGQHLLCAVRGEQQRSSLPSEIGFDLLYLPIADPDRAHVILHDCPTAAFSPNGQEIAYVDYEHTRERAGGTLSLTHAERGSELYKIPLLDIRAKSELARGVRGLAWKGAWTVQHQVVFTRDDSTSIWVVNEDGTNQQEIFRLQD